MRGTHDSQKVYEDDKVSAFLDIRPVNRGHTLVVPKEHYENIHDIPEDFLASVHSAVKKVAAAQNESLSPGGIKVVQNNGKPAGQVVFHFHVHLVPKYESEDGVARDATNEELEEVAEKIRSSM